MSLTSIGQIIVIYGGLFLLVAGVIGNGMNILVFGTIQSYRTTPCTFYFLITSIANLIYLLIILSIRIISTILTIDLARISIVWCKSRIFLIGVCSFTSLACSCLAIIDQLFMTSQNANLRRCSCSNTKWPYRIIFIVLMLSCIQGIPSFIYYDISSITNACVVNNSAYSLYVAIYPLILTSTIPVSIMILFACLTYRNIRLTRGLTRQYADRQLTRMTLIQVIFIVVSIIPYGIDTAYNLFTSQMIKDTDRIAKESFALTVFLMSSYIYYVVR